MKPGLPVALTLAVTIVWILACCPADQSSGTVSCESDPYGNDVIVVVIDDPGDLDAIGEHTWCEIRDGREVVMTIDQPGQDTGVEQVQVSAPDESGLCGDVDALTAKCWMREYCR